jgi:hypothetical protein
VFNVVRVDSRRAEALEPLGTKRKFWFTDGTRRLLFKSEERGTGEDWAEKVACELAGLLGLPHVQYELATETDGERPGVLCESCAVRPVSLVLGNQLMLARDPKYPAEEGRKYKVREHTVDAVAEAVATLELPPATWTNALPPGIETALDVFAGYVMLDAWIANQDRHHENWGALRDGQTLHLAPTFDHGASMARNISDEERHERLTSRDRNRQIPLFARRARSAFYSDAAAAKSMTTVAAWRAFAQKAPGAAAWLKPLGLVDRAAVDKVLAEVPPNRMSGVGHDFTLELLLENQKRLVAGDDE